MKAKTNDYFEASREAFEELQKVKVGDKVKAMGITSTIDTIHYIDVYAETGHPSYRDAKDEDTYYIFYDIEFRDTNGVYRHWKSNSDGGELIHC